MSCISKKVTATWNALKLGFTTVAFSAVTDDLVRGVVSLTRVCIEVTRAWVTRTGTRPTMVTWPKHWISKESFHTTENQWDNENNLRWWKKRWRQESPSYCSHRCPAVLSLQSLHSPVWWSHRSAWPLHWQGLQLGKPHWPGWQFEHCRPTAPCLHWHLPVTESHCWFTEPSGWQSQAEKKNPRCNLMYSAVFCKLPITHSGLPVYII